MSQTLGLCTIAAAWSAQSMSLRQRRCSCGWPRDDSDATRPTICYYADAGNSDEPLSPWNWHQSGQSSQRWQTWSLQGCSQKLYPSVGSMYSYANVSASSQVSRPGWFSVTVFCSVLSRFHHTHLWFCCLLYGWTCWAMPDGSALFSIALRRESTRCDASLRMSSLKGSSSAVLSNWVTSKRT